MDILDVLGLIKSTKHELSIEAAIHGYSPAKIFVDNLENPKAALFKGDECYLLFGDPTISDFYWEIYKVVVQLLLK